MKTKFFTVLSPLTVSLILLQACGGNEKAEGKKEEKMEEAKSEEPEELTKDQMIAEGQLLVEKLGCNDCHSPKMMTEMGPVPDPKLLMSGHPETEKLAPYDKETAKAYAVFTMGQTAAIGPWGTSFAANLTPDETGIKNWTLDNFKKAMREGKYKGMDNTRMLLPPMPWPGYSKLSDEELEMIFHLFAIYPAVKNNVPAAIINMPPPAK